MEEVRYTPIGIIHSPFKRPQGTPIQPKAAEKIEGTVEVFPEYVPGLKDLDGFSRVILLYHFHLAAGSRLEVKPFMDVKPRGVFATRAPARPNPIGMSVVRLLRVEGGTLYVSGVDILDGTPLLDIKPYVPQFDVYEAERTGWLRDAVRRLAGTSDDGRFTKR
jgi:tRNA-Thr(GGU) m(6)t(6)A37 methyltransferase TsaA